MQKAHTLLFSCSQSVLAAGIQQNQPGTEQNEKTAKLLSGIPDSGTRGPSPLIKDIVG